MAYTTIDDPSAYFHTQLYAGDASGNAQNITNDANAGDFKPDWLWIKERTSTSNHMVMDSSRAGDYNRIMPNKSDTEITSDPAVLPLTDGFSVADSDGGLNQASQTYVAWQWKANGGTRVTYSESGDNPAGGYQVNTTAGFSIVDWTGTGGAGGTAAHGLGAVPHVIITKTRNIANDWAVYHHKNTSAPETDYLVLNTTAATVDNVNRWNDTVPTSTNLVFGDGGGVNSNDQTQIAYVFTEIQGYSKFGSYTGNADNNGPFIYLGFSPAWLLIKCSVGHTESWHVWDNKRVLLGGNPNQAALSPDTTGTDTASSTPYNIDFLSSGFKIREDHDITNGDGDTYIYMAFAESPFVSSKGVPTTAR